MSHIIDHIAAYVTRMTIGRLIRSSVRFGYCYHLDPSGQKVAIPGYYYQVDFTSGRYDDRFYPGLSWINQ